MYVARQHACTNAQPVEVRFSCSWVVVVILDYLQPKQLCQSIIKLPVIRSFKVPVFGYLSATFDHVTIKVRFVTDFDLQRW